MNNQLPLQPPLPPQCDLVYIANSSLKPIYAGQRHNGTLNQQTKKKKKERKNFHFHNESI